MVTEQSFAGRIFPREDRAYTDEKTGARVRRVTGWKCNSNHIYFTNNGWYDGGRRLVFCSDRCNRSNLCSLDLANFEITQLTDLPAMPPPREHKLLETQVDPVRGMCYFFCGRSLTALDLKTLETRVIYTMPEKFLSHIVSCSFDSDYVYTSIYEDLSDRFKIDIQRGYVGFAEVAKYGPLSRIVKIKADGSGWEYILEEKHWIAHVNANPKNQNQITFCHEGPWDFVDNRMFGMDAVSGRVWMIHPKDGRDVIGHEYWYQDGVHLGYHGAKQDGSRERVMGMVSFDNSEDVQVSFNFNTGHIFSFGRSLIVGDGDSGGKYIRLWKFDGEKYLKPRALCGHFSTFKTQNDHAHPRFSPDGRQVVFSSDREGYTNVYIADIPDYESLPELDTLSKL